MNFVLLRSLFVLIGVLTIAINASDDGDTKRSAAAHETQITEISNGKDEPKLWAKHPRLVELRERWIGGFDETEQKKKEEELDGVQKKALELVRKLPAALQLYIFDIAHGNAAYRTPRTWKKKFIAQNVPRLIPALMHWDHLFNAINDAELNCKGGALAVPRSYFCSADDTDMFNTYVQSPITLNSPIAREKNSFMCGRFANKTKVFYKVPGCQLRRLQAMDCNDLVFCASLFDTRKEQLEKNIKRISDYFSLVRFDAQQKGISLDENMSSEENSSLSTQFLQGYQLVLNQFETEQFRGIKERFPAIAENLRLNYELDKDNRKQ